MQQRYKFDAENHVHLLDGQPLVGTSRIGNVIAKPLSWYGAGKAVEVFGCPDPKVLTKIKNKKATEEERSALGSGLAAVFERIKEMTPADYLALIDKAYRAHDTYKRERAKGGTDFHLELSKYILACINQNGGKPLECQ